MGDPRARRLRLAVLALFVLSVVGLATVEPHEPGGVLVDAANATERKGTAAFSLTTTTRITDRPVTTTAEGRVDFATGNGTITLHTPPGEMRLVDGTSYTRTVGADRWIAVDAKRFGRGMPTLAPTGGVTDPLSTIEAMERAGVARNVRQEAGEPVRGVPTTRWSADVDPRRLGVDDADRRLVEAMQIQSFRFLVWVDADGVLRRLAVVTQAATLSSEVAIELFDFGVAVTVEPPPADEVLRLPGG